MATFILLADFTDHGFRQIKDSPKRLDTARELGSRMGVKIKDFYLCMGGGHDIITVVDAPNDDAMAKFVLSLATAGAVRTTTLKAFDEQQYRKIIGVVLEGVTDDADLIDQTAIAGRFHHRDRRARS